MLPVFEYRDQAHLLDNVRHAIVEPVEAWEARTKKEASLEEELKAKDDEIVTLRDVAGSGWGRLTGAPHGAPRRNRWTRQLASTAIRPVKPAPRAGWLNDQFIMRDAVSWTNEPGRRKLRPPSGALYGCCDGMRQE